MPTSTVDRHRYWIAPSLVMLAAAVSAAWYGYPAQNSSSPTSAKSVSRPLPSITAVPRRSEADRADLEPQRYPTPQAAAAVGDQATQPSNAAPVIESPELIASMDLEFVRAEVERMDRELEERRAIERLNSPDVSQSERLELGALIQRVALFRHRLLEVAVEELALEVDRHEKDHEARLAELRKKPKRPEGG